MLCEQCKQNPATIHYTQVVHGEKTEAHLCQACAKDQGGMTLEDVTSFLSGLLAGSGERAATHSALRCTRCGMGYDQFRRTGMLGCAQCYQDFRKQLTPVLQRIHGRLQHEGHIPASAGEGLRLKRQIEAARRDLQSAVEQEEFERAAKLRDELRALQRQHEAQQAKPQQAQAEAAKGAEAVSGKEEA